jgi:uncharacterized protein (TIGR02246 family)
MEQTTTMHNSEETSMEDHTVTLNGVDLKSEETAGTAADEQAVRLIHHRMIDAWNAGDGAAFAAPFTASADFVVFEWTHLKGREEIASFNQSIFDTVMAGSRLEGEVKFVRFLSPGLAVLHSVVRVTLPGQTEPSRSRDSMQFSIVAKSGGEWRCEGLMNARQVTMKEQFVLDDLHKPAA